jgi:GntR family transcriptional regulator of abcA and norABC
MSLEWKPNKEESYPLHLQIKEYIKKKIQTGEWSVGNKIPSQRKLAELFDVNRSTVTAALDELRADGLVEGKSGGGTIVLNNSWSLLYDKKLPDWNSYVQDSLHLPNQPIIQLMNKFESAANIIQLGTGAPSPELFSSERMNRVLQKLPERMKSSGYINPMGLLDLRKQVSKNLKNKGIDASPESILIVSGAQQALQLISLGILPRGSNVLVEKPSYLNSVQLFQSMGFRLTGIPMDREGVEIKDLENYKRINHGSVLFTIPSFHNPTGNVMSLKRRIELLEVCSEQQLPIIEDDAYQDLWLDTPPPPPLKAIDKNGIVVYLGTTSKQLDPGLRIGWVVGPEPIIERMADIKVQADNGSSSLSQWAVAEWLESGLMDEHLISVREQLRMRRAVMLDSLNENFSDIAGWIPPSGGFYIWIKLNKRIPYAKLFNKILEKGVLVNPGCIYGTDSQTCLRLSYSYASLTDIKIGIEIISSVIRELYRYN